MKNPISLQKTPAVLSVNFEEAREAIKQHVAKYNIVVTADTVGEAKKTATELNKQAKELDDRRKAAIAEVSAPIREADEQMKQLVTLYKDGRKKIIDQVERFEDETRAEAARKLEARREEVWDSLGVDDEFRAAEYRDLVRLTALTQAGNLAAGAKR